MANLTFKDIAYIRAALECEVQELAWATGQGNNGILPEPLSDDERSDMLSDLLTYDKLLSWFQQWEIQSVPLRVVPKVIVVEEKEKGTG
jgi:hypothetical protein